VQHAYAAANTLDSPIATLALITFNAHTPGTSPLDILDTSEINLLLCGADIVCSDGEIEVLPAADIQATKDCTPNPVLAGGSVSCDIEITNAGPTDAPNVFLIDAIPADKTFDMGASTLGCADNTLTFLGLGAPAGFDYITCGSLTGAGVPFGLTAGSSTTQTIVYDVPPEAAGKIETDIALAFATTAFGIPIASLADPDLDPVVAAIASAPPCNVAPDPAFCAAIVILTSPGPGGEPLFCGGPGLGPLSLACDNADQEDVQVAASDVEIVKTALNTAVGVGNDLLYEVEVTVNPGGSDAADVIITDTVDADQDINSATVDGAFTCAENTGTNVAGITVGPGNTATCTLEQVVPAGTTVTMSVAATVVNAPADNACVNDSDVTFADPVTIDSNTTSVQCFAPEVAMVKSTEVVGTADDAVDTVNLWLCLSPDVDPDPDLDPPDVSGDGVEDIGGGDADPAPSTVNCEYYDRASGTVENNGAGHLVVYELGFSLIDPHGVGAFEFQVKFDHKIFDIEIFHGIDMNADGDCEDNGEDQAIDLVNACFLYQTGRVPEGADFGPDDIGGCEMTIVTENYILFGCVSKNPGDPPVETLGPIAIADVLATLHIDPEPDLVFRLTPGQKNGVLRSILDENCELADIWGDPLADAEGVPLVGIVTGGLVERCDDLHVTTRILEGDLNLDCEVDVTDDQMIAFRYGGFFGNLLYDPWFDLEPSLKDFDIDIKDIQKVFGRNGSTCEDPLPDNQGPEAGGGFNGNPAPNPGP
jgi:uncharacterized repeat protein (TIGR01451 family)